MCATKYFLLLCVAAVVYTASISDCTARTKKHQSAVTNFFKNISQSNLIFDCLCAERAEGLAWFAAIGATTQDYSRYYNVYSISETDGNQKENERVKSLLEKLVQEKPEIKEEKRKNGYYGCAYSTGVKNGNTNHVLTCVFSKTSARCYD
ncbi:hypothetical protein Q1695_015903 [Nippostrongylus brasiliensis]|nr:hypothetical protein Q1695_015903 [Nippostrongylus brasiliensis]